MGGISPLEARGQSYLYLFITVVLIILALLAVIAVLYFKFLQMIHSREWIESQKNKETRQKDITYMGGEANLTGAEKTRLWHICRRYHARNIRYLYRAEKELNELFKTEYDRMTTQQNRNEEKIATFFSLRYKLEAAHEKKLMINSTFNLQPGQAVTMYDRNMTPWSLTLDSSDKNGMSFIIPEEFEKSSARPKPLEKSALIFSLTTGLTYQCAVRCARYEHLPNGKHILFVTHSTNLKLMQRRGSKRMITEIPSQFSAVRNIGTAKKPKYEVLERKYDGTILDISATGCKFSCPMPIKKDQDLQIYFKVPGFDEDCEVHGRIVRTKFSPEKEKFIIHVKFIDIDISVRNDIYAAVYGFKS